MRIVHVVATDAWAGVEGHIATLAAEQSTAGDQVIVIGGDQAAMRERLDPYAVATWPHRSLRATARLLRSLAPDVVNAHMTRAEAAALLGTAPRGAPIVATRHFAQVRGQTPVGRALRPLLCRGIATQIAVSDYVARTIDGPSTRVYAGVPSQPDRTSPGERIVLMAQRLEPEKSTADGVEAFARSKLAVEGWTLRIAGEGSLRPALEKQVRTLGLADAVQFVGRRNGLADELAHAGVVLAPARVDALGLTVIEAMAAGVPVVAAAAGGHLESVGDAAPELLFDSLDDAAVILRELADPQRRRALAPRLQQAQRARFTPEEQARRTREVYRRAMGR